jgi:Fe-S cluster biogenesis protein NfuA
VYDYAKETMMFIQTEATPNPSTLKFLPGRTVMVEGTFDAHDDEGASRSPLAQKLMNINGVSAVFFGSDFISVTRDETDWAHLKPAILGVIMDHFVSGAPILNAGVSADLGNSNEEFFEESQAQTVATIKELLETRIRPAVAGDGGDITFRGFKEGIVYLSMKGACAGCPSSTATLKHGIQNLLRHFLPDVKEVQAI